MMQLRPMHMQLSGTAGYNLHAQHLVNAFVAHGLLSQCPCSLSSTSLLPLPYLSKT